MIDKNKESKKKIWQSFGGLLILNVLITGILGGTFWYFFGTIRVYKNAEVGSIDNLRQFYQDFLSVFASIFTIIGYGLTIFQVWKLRTEQETAANTRAEMRYETFKISTFRDIDRAKNILQDLLENIEKEDSFDKKVLGAYIDKLHSVSNILTEIDASKNVLDGLEVCKNCQNLIDTCIKSFTNVIKVNSIDEIDKITHKGEINSVIRELIKINSQIKN
jgi:flagellin-specific chaperone FliS